MKMNGVNPTSWIWSIICHLMKQLGKQPLFGTSFFMNIMNIVILNVKYMKRIKYLIN